MCAVKKKEVCLHVIAAGQDMRVVSEKPQKFLSDREAGVENKLLHLLLFPRALGQPALILLECGPRRLLTTLHGSIVHSAGHR